MRLSRLHIILCCAARYEEFFRLEFFLRRAETLFAAADEGVHTTHSSLIASCESS
jgi:hypothetical protein